MTKIKVIILALRIEYHWWHIRRGRKHFKTLYSAGFSLGFPQILKLNKRVSMHAVRVMIYEKTYREKYSETVGGMLL